MVTPGRTSRSSSSEASLPRHPIASLNPAAAELLSRRLLFGHMINPVPAARHHPWLHRFAVLTAAATLVLICFGGLVTSHGAGLAVPDWPNTYGYNLFFFPVSQWVGGIFYEHTHRLVGALVGLLTLVLADWLERKEPRAWFRWLGVGAVVAVVLQGVLGGLRVVLLKDQLGLVHGALAQVFFVLICLIALVTSRGWLAAAPRDGDRGSGHAGLHRRFLIATLLVFGQLLLGATMRHRHAGLAVPDFPSAHGRLWPRTDAGSLARYNQQRPETRAENTITAYDVHLHMAHRLGACVVAAAIGSTWWAARRRLGARHGLTRAARAWLILTAVQFGLGATTVWTGKSADIATAHVAVGSLILALGSLQTAAAFRRFAPVHCRELETGSIATPARPAEAVGQPVRP
jgi:heme a synthase